MTVEVHLGYTDDHLEQLLAVLGGSNSLIPGQLQFALPAHLSGCDTSITRCSIRMSLMGNMARYFFWQLCYFYAEFTQTFYAT